MPTVLSRMAMHLKNSTDNSRLHGFGMLIISGNPGDRRLLSQLVFCAIASLILTLITRRIIQRANINLAFVGIIYTALFALYAMLFWLAFSNLFETRSWKVRRKSSSQ